MVRYDLNAVLQFKCNSMFLIITCLVLQFVLNVEQGLPLLSEWLSFTRVNTRARKGVEIGPARILLRYEMLSTPSHEKEKEYIVIYTLKQNKQSYILLTLIGSLLVYLVVM